MAVPTRPPRDERLDVLRGLMQVFIFVSHAQLSIFAWGIHASWGFSDSSEQFMLLSGITLGSVFTLKRVRDGFAAAWRDMRARALRLWRMHLLVFAAFGAMVLIADRSGFAAGDAEVMGWTWLTENPWFGVPAGAAMLYQPSYMDILPVFVWCMLLLPGFVWLLERFGDAALALPASLYAATQLFGLAIPGLGPWPLGFNPLAWQILFMLGIWLGRRALLGAAPLPGPSLRGLSARSALTAAVLSVFALGIWLRAGQMGLLPPAPASLVAWSEKPDLAWLRLAHALGLAWIVAAVLPRGPWMQTLAARLLATIGRQSLNVFCLGLFLSWMVHATLRAWPAQAPALDLLVVPGGVALLWAWAAWLGRGRAAAYRLATARSQ
jgi:hypothetical protein